LFYVWLIFSLHLVVTKNKTGPQFCYHCYHAKHFSEQLSYSQKGIYYDDYY